MSEPVTALNGATFSDGIAHIAEAPVQGMITLRGDLSASALQKALKTITSAAMPGPGEATGDGARGLCWMSPDEILVLCPYADVADTLATLNRKLSKLHMLAVDVSDARAVFHLSGAQAREVMAKLAPIDVSPRNCRPGMFRRTRMSQVAAAIWLTDEDRFQIICFRSQAQYLFDLLCVAAQKGSAPAVF